MEMKFNNGAKEITGFVHTDYHKGVSVYDEHGEEQFCPIEVGDHGVGFTYMGEKFSFSDAVKTSMADIKAKMEAGEFITSNELMMAIICDGTDNVRFGMKVHKPCFVFPGSSVAVCSDDMMETTCKLVNDSRDKPHHNYKLSFVAAEGSDGYGSTCRERYYVSDMCSIIKQGGIKILESINDGKTASEHFDEYFKDIMTA